MRVFIGFKYKTGGDNPEERHVPVMYGDMTRQIANIIKENSENKLPTVPRIACYITGIEMDSTRFSDSSFVSKVNIRERRYTEDEFGERDYQTVQGGNYTVERLMPTPFKLSMKADIWTSNTDQKLQLFEQIITLFNPSLELQTTDNYIDWTSISVLNIKNINFSSRTIPQGTESDIDILSIEFDMPIYISPPAKVKRLGIVKTIIANVFMDNGELIDLQDLIYNNETPDFQVVSNNYTVTLLKSENGQPYDYDVTIITPPRLLNSLDWNAVLNVQGGYNAGSQIYFVQPSGYDLIGTFALNPLNPRKLVVTFDQDTIPSNTLISSSISGVAARGTVDAIIDPYKYNPKTTFNGAVPIGIRFLMLDDVNPSPNVGGVTQFDQDLLTPGVQGHAYDGPDAWKNNDGSDPVITANSIIEWDGEQWVTIWNPTTAPVPTYLQNMRTGIKYRWDGEQWLKAFEGEYAPGYWGLNLDPR